VVSKHKKLSIKNGVEIVEMMVRVGIVGDGSEVVYWETILKIVESVCGRF